MIRSIKRTTAAGLFAAALLFSGAQTAAGQSSNPPAVAYRKSVMDAAVSHVVSLRLLLGSDIGHDADVRKHTAALLATATMFSGIFDQGSTGGASNAREQIWANAEDFAAHMKTFQDAVRVLDEEVAKGAQKTVTMPRLQMVIGTCGTCHTAYKLPAPLPF